MAPSTKGAPAGATARDMADQFVVTAPFACANIGLPDEAKGQYMRGLGLLLAAVSVAFGAPASAQPSDLQAKPGKSWKHKATDVKLPALLAGLQRDNVRSFGGMQTDIAANYWSADGSDNITVFLYRNVSGNASVWFDRARSLILLQPAKYVNPRSLGIRSITPRGQSQASGLLEIFAAESQFRSTGLLLLPVNGFYAKIRASSKSRDAAGLEQLLVTAANSIDWASRQKELASVPVNECASGLPQRGPAKLATISSEDRMMSALIGGVVAQAIAIKAEPPSIVYCRDPGPLQIPYGLYRAGGSNDGYLMALLDSGRTVAVGSSDLVQILSELKQAPRISVAHIALEKTSTYGDFETLPLPDQALEMVDKTQPISVAVTWGGKKRDIIINTRE